MEQVVGRSLRAAGCCNCRLSLLRAFTAVSSISLQPTYTQSRDLQHIKYKQARLTSNFSGQTTFPSGFAEGCRSSIAEKEDEEENSDAGASRLTPVPWYLQVEPPLTPPRSLSDRQQIPDLPESPPKILQPLLQHISLDLGLDDLTLLDLRDLDPPPALGANLLMIIGTARGEKHLHVSADRLCRWLRTKYQLRPDADGLLGRNELKLKMRRKNKRARLLGSGTSNDDGDDGIRTGWVCVNIGMVESDTLPRRNQQPVEGFIGFGRHSEGVKIVVQMLVEEKRQELDLENLWGGIAKRQILSEMDLPEECKSAVEVQSDILQSNHGSSTIKYPVSTSARSTTRLSPVITQSRSFHTHSRWLWPAMEAKTLTTPSSTPLFSTCNQPSDINLSTIQEQVILLLESGGFDAARHLIITHVPLVKEFQNERWRTYLLDWLRSHIENVPPIQALKELGKTPQNSFSTPFLLCFYQTISRFPSVSEWEHQIWLHCFARRLGHSEYTLERFSKLFDDLQLSGTTISNESYIQLLRSTLRPLGDSPGASRQRPSSAQRELAVKILQDMHDRTGNILTEDVFLALQESLAIIPKLGSTHLNRLIIPRNAAVTTYDLPVLEKSGVPDVQSRLNTLMSAFNVRIINNEYRIRLMNLYAKQYNWVEFWRLWRSVAREGEPRSAALWACMFQLVAKTNHQKGCMNVLRTWIPDMDREEPQVRLEGEVLEAVRACLKVADPQTSMDMIYRPEAKGEWINLWRRCFGSLQ